MAKDTQIMLVDDAPADRELFETILGRRLGYSNIVTANNGNEALEMLADSSTPLPGLVLMDTEMLPFGMGYDTCKRMRQLYGSKFSIIGMSSEPEFREKWDGAGADDFFDKVLFKNNQGYAVIDAMIQGVLTEPE